MTQYSKYDLIGKELIRLNEVSQPKSLFERFEGFFFDRLLDSYTFSLKIPNYLYFRGKILCEDVTELSGYPFSMEDLVYLLYRRFLTSVKEIDDPLHVYNLLLVRVPDKAQLKKRGSLIDALYKDEETVQYINLKLKKKYVLRGEVLLRDLENMIPEHNLTVEKLLETTIIDFLKEYQNGNNSRVINSLIQQLEEE